MAAQIEGMFAETLLPEEIAQVAGLLDALAGQEFLAAPLEGRTQILLGMAVADLAAKQGTEATKQNGTHTRLMEGLDAMGHEHRPIVRNATLHDDAEYCGYCPMGCQQACKRSAMKTWLQDASDAGARCVVGCHADRILVDDGRGDGVSCTVTNPDGSTCALTVEAGDVVVACGSIESPALLLRSGVGGPAVGQNLRLHPAYAVMSVYDEAGRGLARPDPVTGQRRLRGPRRRLRLPDRGNRDVPRGGSPGPEPSSPPPSPPRLEALATARGRGRPASRGRATRTQDGAGVVFGAW